MFRLFLRKKILSGTDEGSGNASLAGSGTGPQTQSSLRRNRRVFERYNMDHKHLTLMNDADIFLVREISSRGFSVEVSARGFDRLIVGDIYEARLRYVGEIYDLQARVAWKTSPSIGFEITDTKPETYRFLKRLLRPIEIAGSMQPVDAAFMSEQAAGKSWYHGDQDSDLYVWHDVETSELRAWHLAIGEHYVEWNEANGLTTGCLTPAPVREVFMSSKMGAMVSQPDGEMDIEKQQFAIDVIMALQQPVRDELLQTFGLTA